MESTMRAGRISASFLDFSVRTDFCDRMLNATHAFWVQEMRDLRECGITEVVVARTVLAGRAHYHSSMLEEWLEEDQLAHVMAAAREVGVGVYLGLDLNLFFWDKDRDFGRMLRRDLALNRFILEELLTAHGGNPALRGIYVTHEPDRDNVLSPDRVQALREFLGDMYALVKRQCGLPVFCSPFFSKTLPFPELVNWWADFMDRPMFDILAMQDGIGCSLQRFITVEDIPELYAGLSALFRSRGIAFWNNVESFILTRKGEPLVEAPLDRMARQFEAGRPYVARTITWEYGHFLGRQLAGAPRYEAFKAWNLTPS